MKSRNSDNTSKQFARLLRALASLVETSDPDEVAAFLEGQAALSRGKRRYASEGDRLPLDLTSSIPRDLPKLAETLHSLKSRDEGLSLLSSTSLTRRELEALGRLLGTPILKTDNMERLTEKIIEASIGSRLSSEAIRGDRAK
jgi:hypothetical protein